MKARPSVPTPDPVLIRKKLLAWYRKHGRRDPWSEEGDPYRVWVSEVMLQQTVLGAVGRRYLSWIKTWPDVTALSRAGEEEVLRMFEGLGYYSRALRMLRTASIVVSQHGGIFPVRRADLLSLPGIGPHTASAVASIAGGEKTPVDDANVRRTIQRLLAEPEWNALCRAFLSAAVSGRIPGKINTALMQFGQMVCLPKSPRCGTCPLEMSCSARRGDLTRIIPKRLVRKAVRRTLRVLLWISGGLIWAEEAPGRTGALVLPAEELGQTAKNAADSAVLRLRRRVHAHSKFRDLLLPEVRTYRGEDLGARGRWIRLSDSDSVPFQTAYRKILEEYLGRS